MSSLPNYLLTNRKRLGLSQEEVAFLLGLNGLNKGISVSRNENCARDPGLRTALAYEAIYGKPVRELFAGMYEEAERNVAERARIFSHRTSGKSTPRRQEIINSLAKLTA